MFRGCAPVHVVYFAVREQNCPFSRCYVVARCSSFPSSPNHGSISCTNARDAGSVCIYSCKPGYRLTGGSASTTCELSGTDASWNGSAPNCIRKQGRLYSTLAYRIIYQLVNQNEHDGD